MFVNYETNLLRLIHPSLANIYCSITLSHHSTIMLKKFVSQFTYKLCYWFFCPHLIHHACVQTFDVKFMAIWNVKFWNVKFLHLNKILIQRFAFLLRIFEKKNSHVPSTSLQLLVPSPAHRLGRCHQAISCLLQCRCLHSCVSPSTIKQTPHPCMKGIRCS